MTKNSKNIAPLIIAISLILLMSSIYFHYDSLREADFLYRGLKFETSDLEDLSFDKQNFWVFNPSLFSAEYLSDEGFYLQFTNSSSIFPSSDRDLSVLRC
jgi:hypothetical protein